MKLQFPQNWGLGGLVLSLLLLTGCGDDRPQTEQAYHPPPPPAAAPVTDTAPASASGSGGYSDPLLGSSSTSRQSADPLLSGDPLQGPKMTTGHSHWLRGRVREGRVIVLMNGARQGPYFGVVDQDITMRLRPGFNSVTFVYQPSSATSSAEMEVLESEHDPPIPPLVTFQSPPAPEDGKLTPVTQTFQFAAK